MARSRPSRPSIQRARSLFVALSFFLGSAIAAADATCYDHSGTARAGWKACNPSNPAGSTCCDQNDFCMSNGLCLNAGGNQAYTQQGCTRSDWAAPCVFYCPPGNPSDGLYYMEYCWRGFDKPSDHWCCGVGCCDNGTAISIPVASEIYRAGSLTGSSSTTSSSAPSASGSQSTGVDGRGEENGGSGVSMGLVLGIALGLGIPLLLIAAAFTWFFIRTKKTSNITAPVAGGWTESSGAGQEQGWYVPPTRQAQWSQTQARQQQQQRREQWSPPSELDIGGDPAELDIRNEKTSR